MLTNCNAYDLIMVESIDEGNSSCGKVSCSDAMYYFGATHGCQVVEPDLTVYLLVVDDDGKDHCFPIINNTVQLSSNTDIDIDSGAMEHNDDALQRVASLLRPGPNSARFLLVNDETKEIIGIAPMNIFLWSVRDKIVVVDVDGTITKSTMSGFLYTAIYENFSNAHVHDGICEFLASIPNVRFVYLTNRPITYGSPTRRFLSDLRQGDESNSTQYSLPIAPLIGFTGGLAGVFKMDLYAKNAHEFKHDTLQKYVAKPFRDHGVKDALYAGFGNTLFDMHAYHYAGIDMHRMFLIDKQSTIHCLDDAVGGAKELLAQPKEYAFVRGTSFHGYNDEKLLPHVLGNDKT